MPRLQTMTSDDQVPEVDRRLPGLDGLRGFAALIVLFGHLTADLIAVTGVYLFFVLSAFLLTTQFLRWDSQQFLQPGRLAYYAQRRFLRIYPLFATVAILSWLTTQLHLEAIDEQGLPLTVKEPLLFKVLTLRDGPNVLWTVLVEMRFYIVLPVIAWFVVLLRERSRTLAMAIVFLSTVVAFVLITPQKRSLDLLPFLPLFLTGVLVALLHDGLLHQRLQASVAKSQSFLWRHFDRLMECVAIAGLIGWALTMPIVQRVLFSATTDRYATMLFHWFYAAMFGALLLGILHSHGILRKALETKAAKWLGAISFSLYLWHIGPIRVIDGWTNLSSELSAILSIISAILIASASYWYLERPVLEGTKGWLKPQS